jgi:hypothetical protein
MGIYGQDWASYQSPAPDTTGLGFAFIKVTEGLGYVNPHWEAQRAHAHARGLVVGLYHYPHMANSPQVEADHFLAVARPRPGELLCLDWEGYDPANQGVSRSAQAVYKDAWLHRAMGAAPGNRTGTYCNTDYLRNVDASGRFGDFLWIATAGRAAGSPGIGVPWLFHQYSAAGVDRDFCPLASTSALAQWATVTTPETDMPTTAADAALNAKTLLGTAISAGVSDDSPAQSVGAVLARMQTMLHELRTQSTAQAAAITALAALVGGGKDTAAIVAAVQAAIKDAVIHVEVGSVPPAAG